VSNDSGIVRTAIFSVFTGYFLETLEMRRALLYNDIQSVVSFSVTMSRYFALNSVFVLVLLALTVQLLKNNCVKTDKDTHGKNTLKDSGVAR